MKDQHHSLQARQPSVVASSAAAVVRPHRYRGALTRTHAVWRRRAGAAIPLLLAIVTAVALG